MKINFFEKNIVKVFLYFILVMNFFGAARVYYSGYLGGDLAGYSFKATEEYIFLSFFLIAFLFLSFILIVVPLLYRLFEKVSALNVVDSYAFHSFYFFICLFYLYCSIIGISNHRVNHDLMLAYKYVFYFYSLLSVQFLVFIYMYYSLRSRKQLYYINCFLIFIASYLSGQTLVFILLFPLVLYRFYSESKKLSIAKNIFTLFVGVALYPFFRLLKYAINTSMISDNEFRLDSVFNYFDAVLARESIADIYLRFLFITLERLETVSNLEYILVNLSALKKYFSEKSYAVIDFFIFRVLDELVSGNSVRLDIMQKHIAFLISDNDSWSAQMTFFGPLLIEGIGAIFLYGLIFLTIALCVYITSVIGGESRLLNYLFILLFIMHGWFSPYLYFSYALLVFYFFIILFKVRCNARYVS